MTFQRIACVTAVMASLLGCASNDSAEERLEALAKAEQERIEQKQEQAEARLEEIPEWVLMPPQYDGMAFYGVGSGSSDNLVWANRKARQEAIFTAVQSLRQELTGSERMLRRDNASGGLVERTELLIDSLVERVKITGANVVDTKVLVKQGRYEVFSLVLLPQDAIERAMAQERDQALGREMDEAFDELETRLREREKLRLEREALQQQPLRTAEPDPQGLTRM